MERFTVNGKEVEFDPFDLDAMEAYMEGAALVEKQRAAGPEGESPVAALRRVCDSILDFFDDLLGEGKAAELFGQRVNVKDIFDGYRDFTAGVNGCISAYSQELGGAQIPHHTHPATVPANRAQRRQRRS